MTESCKCTRKRCDIGTAGQTKEEEKVREWHFGSYHRQLAPDSAASEHLWGNWDNEQSTEEDERPGSDDAIVGVSCEGGIREDFARQKRWIKCAAVVRQLKSRSANWIETATSSKQRASLVKEASNTEGTWRRKNDHKWVTYSNFVRFSLDHLIGSDRLVHGLQWRSNRCHGGSSAWRSVWTGLHCTRHRWFGGARGRRCSCRTGQGRILDSGDCVQGVN